MTDDLPARYAALTERHTLMADMLREICRVSTPELNPDGVDQAAETMRLIAVETLRELGIDVPVQRASMDDGTTCICGRTTTERTR